MAEERRARMTSVLGETAVVVGNLKGVGDLEVRGRVQGSIELEGRIVVSDSGVVLGGIEATIITVEGQVRGDLFGQDGVTVEASGQVEGNIAAPRVGIAAGARVRGNLRTEDPKGDVSPDTVDSIAGTPTSEEGKEANRSTAEKEVPSLSETPSPTAKEPSSPRTRTTEKAGQGRSRPRKRKRIKKPEDATSLEEKAASPNEQSAGEPTPPPKKGRTHQRKGPPQLPTFVKGTKGHQRA